MSKFDYINKSLSEFTKNDKPEFRWRQSARMCGELRFKPNKIKELAKGFTNSTQMVKYKGENEYLINQAGRYIEHKLIDRPEWFEDVIKGNAESLEECLEILNNNCTTSNEIYANQNYIRLLNRLWTIYKLSPKEVRKLTPNIEWKTKLNYTDDFIYSILKKYKTTVEVKETEWKKLLHKVQLDKGKEFPKSFKLYEKMKQSAGNKKGLKRGNYDQRTPAIEQYDLNNNYIQTFKTWNDVITAGFKRNSVTGAIRGTDGHNRHKGFIWKYDESEKT